MKLNLKWLTILNMIQHLHDVICIYASFIVFGFSFLCSYICSNLGLSSDPNKNIFIKSLDKNHRITHSNILLFMKVSPSCRNYISVVTVLIIMAETPADVMKIYHRNLNRRIGINVIVIWKYINWINKEPQFPVHVGICKKKVLF